MNELDFIDEILSRYGWERDSDVYGLDFNLICPCGQMIEQDGECSKCGPSPLRREGLI